METSSVAALERLPLRKLIQRLQVLSAKFHLQRPKNLLHMLGPVGTDNRRGHIVIGQNPGDGDLCRGLALPLANVDQLLHDLVVLFVERPGKAVIVNSRASPPAAAALS